MRFTPQLNGLSPIRKFIFLAVISITICLVLSRRLSSSMPELTYYLNILSWVLFGIVVLLLFIARKQEKENRAE